MSTLMTPKLMSMKDVEDQLQEKGLKDKVKTMIPGCSVSEAWQTRIGSDTYGKNSVETVDKIKLLVKNIMTTVEVMKKEKKPSE